MFKKIFFITILVIGFIGFSQENSTDSTEIVNRPIIDLKGVLVNGFDKKPLKGAHVYNMNLIRGTISNNNGSFVIPTRVNDTIFFSHLGFQSVKIKITNDLLKGNELEISLYERAEEIAEVRVKSIKLVGVLEIDARNVPKDKYTRIHINGLPQTYEVGRPRQRVYNSPIDAIFHPIDFVYNLFGKKPKQLRRLKQLRKDNEIRDMLDKKVNREIMLEYLELSRGELDELLDECNYSDYFIRKASDIQVIEAVLECYESHKAIKKGSTKRKE
ncbi:MAG: carboxypeptidase-like regulatory domain-containing protein [Flavobacteriaceae bacterium]|nr:carboxypeptidase-like regulatory domain-containing protein [Flavobacteriaceae bacterium]